MDNADCFGIRERVIGRRRVRFTDPPPLSPDAPAYASDVTRAEYEAAVERATARMKVFDKQGKRLRAVERAVGMPEVAQSLYRQGVKTEDEADRVWRNIQTTGHW